MARWLSVAMKEQTGQESKLIYKWYKEYTVMNDDFNSLKLMFYAGQVSVKCQRTGLDLTTEMDWETGGSSGNGDMTQGSGTLGGGRDICGVSDDDDDDHESDQCEKTERSQDVSMSGKWHLAN